MDNLPEVRQRILANLKETNGATTAEVADHLSITYEAVRQHLTTLENDGLITKSVRRNRSGEPGRPAREFQLTERGEDLFPKAYDELAVEMIDTIGRDLGPEALRRMLASFADTRVSRWKSEMEGLDLEERLEVLQDLYVPADPHTSVEADDGELLLIERNCPFLNVAKKRPALCSVTISTLQRLLGHHVERIEKFQAGDGRCVFRVRTDMPLDDAPAFEFEDTPEG